MLNLLRSNPNIRGLSALYAGTFLSGAWAMMIPTIPVLARQFGVSAGGAAQIVTAFAIGRFVGTAIAGMLLDRMGTRVALVAGPLVASVAALSVLWAPWLFLTLFLALIMGAADSLWSTAREVAGIDLAHRRQRGRVISSLHGVNTIGAAFSPLVGGWLTESFNFKAAFLGYAIASAMSVPLGFIVPNFAVPSSAAIPPLAAKGWHFAAIQRRLRGVKDLYREIRPELRPTYCAITFATLVNQSQRVIVQSMLPLYAGYYLQLPPTQVGMLFTISGVIVFVMIIPAGFLMDRVGRKWCTVPSTGISADSADEQLHTARDSRRDYRDHARIITRLFGDIHLRRRAGACPRPLAGAAPHDRRAGQQRCADNRWHLGECLQSRFTVLGLRAVVVAIGHAVGCSRQGNARALSAVSPFDRIF
jgi:MFS family permease